MSVQQTDFKFNKIISMSLKLKFGDTVSTENKNVCMFTLQKPKCII